ncbi:unnamed protein product [Euphydryas editha]|uniref:DUF4371 domain-containing protein n=1 Tax=Euphydryas editha TaxID=104508 RepID=A0AAU9TPQ1_EUPED|nr:unnamed protein product [Euphydryas editha]
MEIPTKKKSYSQKYRKEWEDNPNFKGWLAPVQGTDLKGMCRWCQAEFFAKISDIKKHSESKKHKSKAEIITKQKPFPPFPVDKIKPSSRAEAAMALFIAEHCSVVTVEHLGEMCKKLFSDSKYGHDIHIHRTKCSEIINEVLGPHFKESLRLDICDQKFSLILDESTDISVMKCLGIAIRYFSNSQNKVLSTFLALTPVTKADAKGLAEAIINTLNDNNLKLKNLVGIGTDNASVMTGVNNGLHQILKREHGLPNLVLVRCVCHSLQLAVSHASEKTLPRNIEYIIRETYNWFSLSPKRQDEYRQIYETINCGSQPLKILKMCTTRWLSIFPAVSRILQQWDELKLHFSLCKVKENCYTAELLHAMFEDGSNLLYMTYIQSILGEVQTALKVFESENADPTKLLEALTFLLRSICNRVIYSHADINVLTTTVQENHLNPYATLGYAFEMNARKLNLSEDVTNIVKHRCVAK